MKLFPIISKKKKKKSSLLLWDISDWKTRSPKTGRAYRYKRTSALSFLHVQQKIPYIFHYIILAGLVVVFVLIFLFSHIFHISSGSLYIFRNDTLVDINRAYETLDYTRWQHIAFIHADKIKERLSKTQPWIKDIYIRRSLPNKLYISLRSQKVIFQSKSSLILESWDILIKENKKYIWTPPLKIYDTETASHELSRPTIDARYLSQIHKLQKELEKSFPGFEYDIPLYYIREQNLIIRHPRNTLLIFDLDDDISRQVQKLKAFHDENTNIHETSFVYIDVRIPRKIHLCWLKDEYQCRSTLERYYWFRTFEFLESL